MELEEYARETQRIKDVLVPSLQVYFRNHRKPSTVFLVAFNRTFIHVQRESLHLQDEVASLNAQIKEITGERDDALDAPSQLRQQNEAMVYLLAYFSFSYTF
jgi:hypothetical protein